MDKKGILSWPNPTAEKVFFLKNGSNHKNRRSARYGCNIRILLHISSKIDDINLHNYFSEMSGPSFRSFSSPATASESPDDTHESHETQDIKDKQKNTNDTHIEVFSSTK